MAEERVKREAPRKARRARPEARRSENETLSGEQLAQAARRQLAAITGMEPETVTSLARHDDNGWRVTVEMVELSRIPKAADVLGVYEVTLDAGGALQEYRRLTRYARGQTGGREDG